MRTDKQHKATNRKRLLVVIAFTLFAVVAANVVVYNQAYAMLNFEPQATRTSAPDELSTMEKAHVLLWGVTIPKPALEETPRDYGLAFRAHSLSTSDGLTLEGWYVPHPAPQGMVLLFHGYAGSKSGILPEAAVFHELGYSTFSIDFRASGGSDGTQTTIGFREATDVAAAVQHAKSLEQGPLILFGSSMGGVALLRAISLGHVQPDAIIIEAVFDTMLSTVKNRFDLVGLPSFPAARLLIFWAGVQSGFSGFRHNPADYAASVSVPALLLHGARDTRVTREQAELLFDSLGSSRKDFELFESAAHADALIAEPDQWKKAVSAFLSRN